MARRVEGFTIIEVVLFLGISSALAIGVLASSSLGINTQRYRDAVTTFSSQLQQEFTRASNPENDRQQTAGNNASCLDSARGASKCILMGRLVTVTEDGSITRTNIIGEALGPDDESWSDKQAIIAYQPAYDTENVETGTMAWGTRVVNSNGQARPLSIAILRSPTTGNIRAYIFEGAYTSESFDLSSLEDNTTDTTSQTICVDPSGWVTSAPQAVVIEANAAGPNSVGDVQSEEGQC